MTDPLLARLGKLDTCAISDALDSKGLNGVLLGLRPLANGKRIVGRAVTVDLALDTGIPSSRHLCTSAVEASGPSDIIMVAHDGRLHVAGWGGILSTGAVANKVAGVIIDGACRDLDQSQQLGLTLYGGGSVPVTARGRIVERDWNVPVTMAGVVVSPRDLVLADGSGVVVVPLDIADEILTAAEAIAARELSMEDRVRAGEPISQVMGKKYETMLKD